MKKLKLIEFTSLFIMTLLLLSCNKDFKEILDKEGSKTELSTRNSNAIMELSFVMQTSKTFETPPFELSDLDLSMMNPSNEKQHVEMQLLANGQMNIIIETVDFPEKIVIDHQTLPDNTPAIVKTEIVGNAISFYDKNGNLLSQENFDFPNQIEKVRKIQELGNNYSVEEINSTLATMQGQQYISNLEEYIENAAANGAQIVEQGENYVTIRTSFKHIDPRMEEETVMLIDKRINKMVGSRIYDKSNKLLQSIFYGYKKGEVQSLKAIRIEQKMSLPSGKEVNMLNLTKIDNLQMSINI